MKKYKLAVYIGRFQPFHLGHRYVIDEALKIADQVLVLVGSANASRSIRNPFSLEERVMMIEREFVMSPQVIVRDIDDYTYEENQWAAAVQDIIYTHIPIVNNDVALLEKPYVNPKITMIGHSKDDTSYYLKNFPQYDLTDVEYHNMIDATQIRDLWYEGKFKFIQAAVPNSVYNYLVDFPKSKVYNMLLNEYNYVKSYKESWAGSPYPPIFQAVDAVVIQSGHILLIKRGNERGTGLWALPGGFLDVDETLEQGCIRELREETKLKVPVPVLKGSITKNEIFDSPKRSNLGRIITTAFLIQLDDSQDLPKVKGGDDAAYAAWIPLAEFYSMAEIMFSDHYHIITKMIDNI